MTTWARTAFLIGAAAAAVAIPMLLPPNLQTAFLTMVLAAISATGLSLLMGFGGQVSLGQGAFFGVGAITAALISTLGMSPLLGFAAAPVAAALAALVAGAPLLRLTGHYLAFGTLALQLILIAIVNSTDVLGGPYGFQGLPYLGIGGWEITNTLGYVYVALGALALVLFVTSNLVRSRFGRGIRALSSSFSAAESSGVPVYRYKLSIFVVSGAFAGLAGGISAFAIGFVSAGSFPIMLSIQLLVMAVVGGLGTLWGGAIGAVAVTVVVQLFNAISTQPGMPATAPAVMSYAAYAGLLILTLLFLPGGIVGSFVRRTAKGLAS